MDGCSQDSYRANGSDDAGDEETKKGKTGRRRDLPVSEIVYGAMLPLELSQAQQEEVQLAQHDLKMEQTKDRKNSLESYVYETRNKLLNTYRSFASDAEKYGISSSLQQTEEWLYEDGDDESEHVYSQKLEDLRKDGEARAQSTRDLLNCIVEHRMAAETALPSSERDAVITECNKAEQWLRELTQQQDSLPKHAEPVLWSVKSREKPRRLTRCKHITRPKSHQIIQQTWIRVTEDSKLIIRHSLISRMIIRQSGMVPPRSRRDYAIIEEKIKSFSSPNPFFWRLLKDYNVNTTCTLSIPKLVTNAMLSEETRKVTLKNKEGRYWEVLKIKRSNGQDFFSATGWRSFVVENCLKVGDVCIFEQVGETEFQVHIF